MNAPLLQIRSLSVSLPSYADRSYAVINLNLDLAPRETLCIVGESGSGKSITARAILRLLPAHSMRIRSGEILLEGNNLLELPERSIRAIRGADISMVFQEPMTALNPLMTIGAQCDEVLRAHTRMGRDERIGRVQTLLSELNLKDVPRIIGSYPHQLSGGQRQRAAIGMSLLLNPKVLLADEPTTALDVTTQAQILKLLKQLQQKSGMGIIFITHDFGVVSEIADRVMVMRNGEVVEAASARQVLSTPQHEYTRKLISAVPGLTPKQAPSASSRGEALSVSNVSKTFAPPIRRALGASDTAPAVSNVSLQLKEGETLGIVGESGSGKSTLARIIMRLVAEDAGRIDLLGVDLTKRNRTELRRSRANIQMVFQDPNSSLNPRWRVGRIIAEGLQLVGIRGALAIERAKELIKLVGLSPSAIARYPGEFSGGQRQRIAIARALATNPKVLVADEAVSALDVSIQAEVLELFAELQRSLGLALVFITHDLRVAARMCDSIAVMKAGRVVEYGPVAQIFGSPSDPYTRSLLEAVPGFRDNPLSGSNQWSLKVVGAGSSA